jgi:hypothetical protein
VLEQKSIESVAEKKRDRKANGATFWRAPLVKWAGTNKTGGGLFKSCKGSLRSLTSLKPLLTALRRYYKKIFQQFLKPKIFKSMVTKVVQKIK